MTTDVESSVHAGEAMGLSLDGYDCAQFVSTAFYDLHGMDEKEALRLGSSFGGGMGWLREVYGVLSDVFMTAGLLYGYDRQRKAMPVRNLPGGVYAEVRPFP